MPETKKLECPLCHEQTLVYEEVPSIDKEKPQQVTHAWVCEECPAVVMEFHQVYDVDNLRSRLIEGKKNV